jgi:hypothetical protein
MCIISRKDVWILPLRHGPHYDCVDFNQTFSVVGMCAIEIVSCVVIMICVSCSLDLPSLLQKPVGEGRGGGGDAPSTQSLVFTNSHHHSPRNGSAIGTGSTSYAHAALVSHTRAL